MPDMTPPQPASMSRPSTNRSKTPPPPPAPWELADDLLVEIFAWLPAKAVGRFRCLSRSCAAMLSSTSFADLHLERANDGQRKQPKIFYTTAPHRLQAWHHAPPPVLRELTDVTITQPLHDDWHGKVAVSKPCHGLTLLLRFPCHGHYVCNPCTGALLPLPDTKTPSRMCGHKDLPGTYANAVSYGLGYDSATKEHKVVRLFYLREEGAAAVTACEVFTIGGPAASEHWGWRPAAQRPPPCSCTMRVSIPAVAVFFIGRLHFIQHGVGCGIVTFDVHDEIFGSLTPPSGIDDVTTFGLAVLDGCLCLHYGLDTSMGDAGYHIWRLRSSHDHGAGGQWEKLYCIQHKTWPRALLDKDLEQISPLEIYHDSDGRKKIMFASNDPVVFTVDIDVDGGGAPKILLFMPSTSPRSKAFAVGLLQDSLVSVGRTSEEIIFSSPSMKAWSNVLKWLPKHTVVSLMHVCRAWREVIKSDRFIQSHTMLQANMSKKSPKITLIAPFYGIFWPTDGYFDTEIDVFDMFKFVFGRGSRVVCSKPCHGLVVGTCTHTSSTYRQSRDFICNPTMGYYKKVHRLNTDGDAFFLGGIGLGYDSSMKKHILVRLVYNHRDLDSRHYQLSCYVRHIDMESWRRIKPPPKPVAEMQSIHVDGKLYWIVDHDLGTESSWPGCEMLVLDVTTEEFSVLEGPGCDYEQIRSIVELQGNVCVVCSDESRNAMDIWMLESGVWSTWCRVELDEISADYSLEEKTEVLEVDSTNGRLLLSTGKVLGYYDPITRTVETIHRLVGRPQAEFAPVLCQESLISPYIRLEAAMLM